MWGRGLGMGDAVLGPRLPPHAAHRAGPVSSRPWEHRIARRHCPEPQTRHAADVLVLGAVCAGPTTPSRDGLIQYLKKHACAITLE